jgi:prophage DNA circulation protein
MIGKPEYSEALGICQRLMKQLVNFSISPGLDGANLHTAVGTLLGNLSVLIDNQTVGAQLLLCFDYARIAGATLNVFDNVREAAAAELPQYSLGIRIINAALILSLSEQSQLITAMTFASRNDVDELMDAMSIIIDDIKLRGSETFAVNDYRNVVALSASLIYHLSATERLLPQIVSYQMPINYPALALANRIYGDASRSDELIAENKTIHPAFMQRDIIALST